MAQSAADRAIAEALRIIGSAPQQAEAAVRAVLQANPAHSDAKLVLSEALRRQGKLDEARALVGPLAAASPQWFGAHRQLGMILADLREALPASLALRAAADINPTHPTIWRDLADQLALAGDMRGAEAAYARHAGSPTAEPRLLQAGNALRAGKADEAASILQTHLAQHPSDTAALRLLAEAAARADRPDEAEAALKRCIALAPDFLPPRHALGQLLMGRGRLDEAGEVVDQLLKRDPGNRGSRRLLAALEMAAGDYEAATGLYEKLLEEDGARAQTWLSYGHALKTVGRTDEGIAAYRRTIEIAPSSGEAYWSLANLKTVRFGDADIAAMKTQSARSDLLPDDLVGLHYALGRAMEQRGDVANAFAHYSAGAAAQSYLVQHDADALSAFVTESIAQFDAEFFARRAGYGDPAPDPIFIIGLPRSGSTLVEQILASHSAVEGTMELPDLFNVARKVADGGDFLPRLAALDADAARELGASYLRTTHAVRQLGRAYFIDKMPNNWMYAGLIMLALPNAKIIDARRHPLACGWSCFKQHFAFGQAFSYDLAHIGRYYADYVRLMAHFDAVVPGRVHRVIHEELVSDPEPHIRALLAYCDLPFEAACLRPHETQRAVKTASSEQVRQPISAKGLDDWKPYEPYLDPLKKALGPVLNAYPNAPA
ncbi:MAG: sulfotransferase [Hyphomonadaceae bacterium]